MGFCVYCVLISCLVLSIPVLCLTTIRVWMSASTVKSMRYTGSIGNHLLNTGKRHGLIRTHSKCSAVLSILVTDERFRWNWSVVKLPSLFVSFALPVKVYWVFSTHNKNSGRHRKSAHSTLSFPVTAACIPEEKQTFLNNQYLLLCYTLEVFRILENIFPDWRR